MPESSYCFIHNEHEPVPQDFFLICFECKHVFRTAQDLVDAHNTVLANLAGPGDKWKPVVVEEVEDIWVCPMCVHDF